MYIIGLDIGTTGCRSIIFDEKGCIVGASAREYPVLSPHPAWAEEEPEEVLSAVIDSVRDSIASSRTSPQELSGISLSSAFHSLMAMDKDGNHLTRLTTWADNRSQACTEKLKKNYNSLEIYQRTGCPLHPMYSPSKILWIKENMPEVYEKVHKFITIKEYIIYKWFGKYVVDWSVASGGGLLNIHKKEWDDYTLAAIGITPERLSQLVSPTYILEGLDKKYAQLMGIPASIPVIIGAGDAAFSTIGSGAIDPGQMTVMIGSSGAVRILSPEPKLDKEARTWCYVVSAREWLVGGAINNAGITYHWFRDNFASLEKEVAKELKRDVYEILNEYAKDIRPGSDGLLFMPYLAGERSPYWNANARGVIFGLSLAHTKRHLVRAIMEGVIYRLYSVFLALEEMVGKPEEIRATGGGARSSLWVQIMADVFGQEILVPEVREASSLGAATLGMVVLGFLKDIREGRNFVFIKESYQPNFENHKRYGELFKIYERVYKNLLREFDEIARIQRTL